MFRLPRGYYPNWLYTAGAVVGTVAAAALGAGSGWEALFPYGFITGLAAEWSSRALWWFNHRDA